ncbi:hypothetical protein EVG20_g4661 [Dentipellis fragilis]|uniref:G-patch domain-containing protein n=1 Tax=Dentipellis fragilis TaxID=205917 RepID=A0A4Y9YZ75_9AGAM|nr:hypothetical protein EVG20_g4661 [Dentipellis fragilis]
MPLDGHSYLVSQGWSGTGTGLRTGSISQPLAIPQKKNLAGLGKDRDEAFPFWDHLFTAAASAIKLKVADSDSDGDSEDTTRNTTAAPDLSRTSTGILSNRRPVLGTPVTSGTCTPDLASASALGTSTPRLTLMAMAKRQAAQRGLYSRFFRGPVIGPDDVETEMIKTEVRVVEVLTKEITAIGVASTSTDKRKAIAVPSGEKPDSAAVKKRRREEEKDKDVGDDVDKRELKRRKKERKEQEKKEKKEKKLRKELRKAMKKARADGAGDSSEVTPRPESDLSKRSSKKNKSNQKEKMETGEGDDGEDSLASASADATESSKARQKKTKDPSPDDEGTEDEPRKAKKSKKRTKVSS